MKMANIAIPAIILVAPLLAMIYFFGAQRASRSFAPVASALGAYSVFSLVSLWGITQFPQMVRMDFWWPFSAEPSGYFKFALQLHWSRFLWVFVVNIFVCGFLFWSKRDQTTESVEKTGFLFFLFAAFFLCLGFLSENIPLSILFFEIAFLLHLAHHFSEGDLEGASSAVSCYIKRLFFLCMSVGLLVLVAGMKVFGGAAVALVGASLYLVAFLFSRRNETKFQPMVALGMQGAALFFLLDQSVAGDFFVNVWTPLAIVFGIISVVFSLFAVKANSRANNAFWIFLAWISYLVSFRLGSGAGQETFWVAYEAVGMVCGLVIYATVYSYPGRAMPLASVVCVGIAAIFLGTVSSAIPGLDPSIHLHGGSMIRLASNLILTFFLSLAVGRGMAPKKIGSGANDSQNFPWTFVSLGLVIVILGFAFQLDFFRDNPYRMGLVFLISSLPVFAVGAIVMLGLALGMLLGANESLLKRIGSGEISMEKIFPPIELTESTTNGILAQFRVYYHRVPVRINAAIRGVSEGAQIMDERFWMNGITSGFREYGASLSLLTRFFHSGSVRAYWFWGVIFSLLVSALFLMGVA